MKIKYKIKWKLEERGGRKDKRLELGGRGASREGATPTCIRQRPLGHGSMPGVTAVQTEEQWQRLCPEMN